MNRGSARSIARFLWLAPLSGLTGLFGCEQVAEPETQFEVRDSANVRIVVFADYPRDLPVWCLASEPDLVLGSVEGNGPHVFGRISAAAERSDGVIVVGDGLASEVRAFNGLGEHQWSTGGRGEGPGEYQSVDGVFSISGDSTAVFDQRLSRVTILDPDGRTARTIALTPPPDNFRMQLMGVTEAGTLVGRSYLGPFGFPPAGWNRPRLAVSVYDRDGIFLEVVAEVPGSESFVRHGVVQGRPGYMSYVPRAARRTQVAVGRRRVATATQDRFEIRQYADVGRLEMILRIQVEPIVPDAEMAAAYDTTPGPLPKSLPSVGRVHYDSQDRLWVEEYVPLNLKRPGVWWVFDQTGGPVAEVIRPDGEWSVQYIALDHLVGVTSDSFGVEYLQRRFIHQECSGR